MADRIKALHLITVFILIIVVLFWLEPPNMMSSFIFSYFLGLLAVNDWDRFTLPLSLVASMALFGFVHTTIYQVDQLVWNVLAAFAGFGVFMIIAYIFFRRTGQHYLGQGDAYLMFGLGAWLGPIALVYTVLLGSIGGLIFMSLTSLLTGSWDPDRKIPFGTFLCTAAWIVWLDEPFLLKVLSWI